MDFGAYSLSLARFVAGIGLVKHNSFPPVGGQAFDILFYRILLNVRTLVVMDFRRGEEIQGVMRFLEIELEDRFQQLVDWLNKHNFSWDSEDDFLTDSHKKLLDERLERAKSNPESTITLEEFSRKMKQNLR